MFSHLSSIPLWLHVIAALVALEAIVSRVIIKPDVVETATRPAPPPHIQAVINFAAWVVTIIYIGVIGFFWAGHNWARVIIIAGSAISLWNGLLSFKVQPKFAKTYLIFDSIFSACVIVWLLQPTVSAYFLSQN